MNVYTFRAITNYDVIIVKKAKKVLTDWCNAKFKSEWWVKTIKLLEVNLIKDFLF